MPLLMKHTGPLWGIWKIEEPSEVLFALLQNRKEYLPQLELIRTEQRRREWLASRVLLQELTGGSALIAYHPNGAPYLSGSSLHISISHTKGYAAVLLQDHPAAGIDIEYRSERVSRIRSRFMNPEEEAGIDKEYETEHLLLHWCPFPYAEKGSFTVYETRTGEGTVYRLNYLVTPDFVLTRS